MAALLLPTVILQSLPSLRGYILRRQPPTTPSLSPPWKARHSASRQVTIRSRKDTVSPSPSPWMKTIVSPSLLSPPIAARRSYRTRMADTRSTTWLKIVSISGIVKNLPTSIKSIETDTKIWTADGTIFIHTSSPQQIQVVNLAGSTLFYRNIPVGDTRLNGLAAGVYIVRLSRKMPRKIIVR